MLNKRLTIMVPAFNEEGNLEDTIKEIELGIGNKLRDFEIIIINDFSSDNTGKIAQNLAKKNKKIKVFHNKKNKGLGFNYREGIKHAKFEYYMYIPGDNQLSHLALRKIIRHIGKADILIPYVTNMHIRPLPRQIVSATFTFIINLLFGLNIKYYNSTVVHKTALVKAVPPKFNGHAYQAEILVRLIKDGSTYLEVGYEMVERNYGSTSAFRFKNIKNVLQAIIVLFFDIYLFQRNPAK